MFSVWQNPSCFSRWVLTDRQLFSFSGWHQNIMFSLLKRLNFTPEAACHLCPAVSSTALSAVKMTNTLTQRQKSLEPKYLFLPIIRAALFLRTVAAGSGLTTKFLLLLQNNQRVFWMELATITLGTISHVYKSEANFLCKSPVGWKDANLCHMRWTASFIQ